MATEGFSPLMVISDVLSPRWMRVCVEVLPPRGPRRGRALEQASVDSPKVDISQRGGRTRTCERTHDSHDRTASCGRVGDNSSHSMLVTARVGCHCRRVEHSFTQRTSSPSLQTVSPRFEPLLSRRLFPCPSALCRPGATSTSWASLCMLSPGG